MKYFKVLGISTGLAWMAMLYTACGGGGSENQAGPVSYSGTIGVRSFAHLNVALASVTGVPATTTVVSSYYQSAKSRLPLDGNPEALSSASLLAAAALTGVYCSEFIKKEALVGSEHRLVHNVVDFNRNQTALSPDSRAIVIERYAELFWRRSPTTLETEALLLAMQEAEAGRAQSATEMKNLLLVVCTAVGSSFDSIRH